MSEVTLVHEDLNKSVEIEQAQPEDAEAICDIRDKAWLKTYPNPELGITEEDVLLMAQGPDGKFLQNRIAYLKEELGKEDAEETTFVAKHDGKVLGFVSPHIDEQGHQRVGALYVASEAQGRGIGTRLMQEVLKLYGTKGDIYLNVVSYNQNAINFYEKFGFEKTDAVVQEEEGRPEYLKTLPEIEMVLRAS